MLYPELAQFTIWLKCQYATSSVSVHYTSDLTLFFSFIQKPPIAIAPHQLRHTCATLLLNAGMSIFALQALLGHKYVDTTLRYARTYDATVVKDYQEAVLKVTQPEI